MWGSIKCWLFKASQTGIIWSFGELACNTDNQWILGLVFRNRLPKPLFLTVIYKSTFSLKPFSKQTVSSGPAAPTPERNTYYYISYQRASVVYRADCWNTNPQSAVKLIRMICGKLLFFNLAYSTELLQG